MTVAPKGLEKTEGNNLLLTIPNLLGFARILAGPYVAYLLWQGQYDLAFWIFLIAGLTDAIDGPIARKMGTANNFGLYLDPIADKLFINIIYIALLILGFLPSWIVILVFFRDFLISSCILLSKAFKLDMFVKPALLSKINTGLQIALAALIMGGQAFDLTFPDVTIFLMYLMAATTFVSGGQYLARWLGIYPKE